MDTPNLINLFHLKFRFFLNLQNIFRLPGDPVVKELIIHKANCEDDTEYACKAVQHPALDKGSVDLNTGCFATSTQAPTAAGQLFPGLFWLLAF